MKSLLTTAAVAVLALGAAAAPAAAKEASEVRVRNAVARMVVIVENRADTVVEVQQGSAGLPALRVTRSGDELRIDGGLGRNAIRNCRSGAAGGQPGEGASVEVRGQGQVNVSSAPLIVVRTPSRVDVEIKDNSAVFGAIGRGASSVSLASAGCGDWTIANTEGEIELALAGSGDIRLGSSRSLEVSLAGSGNVSSGATRSLEANIAGSGDISVARLDGPLDANIAGSGDITVAGGAVGQVSANIVGSGDVAVRGPVAGVSANVMGSGDVVVQSVSGSVERHVMGSGRVRVGG